MNVAQAEERLKTLDGERAALVSIIKGVGLPDFNPRWVAEAVEYGRRFVKHFGSGHTFVAANLRVWAHDHGCPIPRSQRAWSRVVVALEREGLTARQQLIKVSYSADPYVSAGTADGQFKMLWRVL